ncbi:MAG: uncharacterized protein JWO77_3055 [Ilumatobacteraceae bacterium]|nr:uncharacterized protein [Ilumatobacteraceae bacterium]
MSEPSPGGGERPELDPVEQRIVGSLLEKERTVPASYPMTLNGLRTACNQSSSREPVMDLDEATIESALGVLKAKGLTRMVYAGSGARAVKYRQVLDERLGIDEAERAILTVLLLRGPQAPGELKARTDRLHRFADRDEVERHLQAMAGGAEPLVAMLERLPGHQDHRWIHLLGPVEIAGPGAPAAAGGSASAVDRDVVLAEGPVARDAKVVATYDALAGTYADRLAGELDSKPFDRWILERLVDLADGGPVADAGCGPGQVAFYLALCGADVAGFDLSPGMIDEARRRFPELPFEVADLTALPAPAAGGAWAVIAAWYSLVHLAGSELRPAVALLADRLAPGGWLAVAVHVGDEVRHLTELWDEPVDVSFVFHDPAAVLDAFATAGLVEVEWYRRGPLPDGEAETERLYVLGRRPA